MNKFLKIFLYVLAALVFVFLMTREFDFEAILSTGGLLAIGAIVFAETGLLVGFFLPGDTLLFAAGFFAAQDKISLVGAIAVIVIGAITGNMVGYEIGRRNGKRIFSREDSILFHKKYIVTAEEFFKKHGGKTILFARFVPVVRTLAPLIAGTGKMDYKRFMFYNVTGALIWGTSVTLIGYWAGTVLGEYFDIDKYLLPVILLATVATFGASFAHALREPETRKALIKKIKYNYKTLFKN